MGSRSASSVVCESRHILRLVLFYKLSRHLSTLDMTESVPKVTPEMIRYFDGEGDLMAWLAKAKLVAKLAKISDLACFLPLYLEVINYDPTQ